jgi:hypothetical protein
MNGMFVISGAHTYIYVSNDGGKTWTTTDIGVYTNTPSVIGQTVYVPTQGNQVLSSRDGINVDVYYSAFTMR